MLILKFFYMVIIKNYKVKKLFNKFPEISGNFRTHNPTVYVSCIMYEIFFDREFLGHNFVSRLRTFKPKNLNT